MCCCHLWRSSHVLETWGATERGGARGTGHQLKGAPRRGLVEGGGGGEGERGDGGEPSSGCPLSRGGSVGPEKPGDL